MVRTICAKHDVVFLQETKVKVGEDSVFTDKVPSHRFFYGNKGAGRAGVLTAIALKALRGYSATVVGVSPQVSGHLLVIRLTPKSRNRSELLLVNVLGPHTVRLRSLLFREMSKLRTEGRCIVAGDFNFTEFAADNSSSLTGPQLRQWEVVKANLGLSEVYQPTHTFYSTSDDTYTSRMTVSTPTTARLTR